jgi:chromosome segregation ATPase
VAPHED